MERSADDLVLVAVKSYSLNEAMGEFARAVVLVSSQKVDVVLLDNMRSDMSRQAVGKVDRRATTEPSGRIRPDAAPAIAASGVDLLSVGWLTHSAMVLDIGLDHLE